MRGTDINQWALKVAESKPKIDELVSLLKNYGASVEQVVSNDIAALHYQIRFFFADDEAMVTIGIIMMDWQTNSDIVIATMTTLPAEQRGKGFGRTALSKLLRWAKDHNLKKVCATQVSGVKNRRFWMKNGFTELGNPTGDFLLIL